MKKLPTAKRKRQLETTARTASKKLHISQPGRRPRSLAGHERPKRIRSDTHPKKSRRQSLSPGSRGSLVRVSDEKKNWLFTNAQLALIPSRRHGISKENICEALCASCRLIDTVGKKLLLKTNPVLATAQVFLHRFFSVQSLKDHDRTTVAITCLFVAAKIEDGRKRFCDSVVTAFFLWKNTNAKKGSNLFTKQKQQIFLYETIILQTLRFHLNVVHPYTFLPQLLKSIQLTGRSADSLHQIAKMSTIIVNDSFKTNLCVRFVPRKIAATAVFLATRLLNTAPLRKATVNHKDVYWRKFFNLNRADIDSISATYFELGESALPDSAALRKVKAAQKHATAQRKAKAGKAARARSKLVKKSPSPHVKSETRKDPKKNTTDVLSVAGRISVSVDTAKPVQQHSAFPAAQHQPPTERPNPNEQGLRHTSAVSGANSVPSQHGSKPSGDARGDASAQ